jgi:beta-glucosidase/6-phospho-beta-glucosidase/beta-galactosidase
MGGNEEARSNLGIMELKSGRMKQAVKHFTIAASDGSYRAMHTLRKNFEIGVVSRDTVDSTLTAYNSSCAEMRSKARDACIQVMME